MPQPESAQPPPVPLQYTNVRVKTYTAAIVCGVITIGVGIVGCGITFYLASTLNSVPPGSSIRPMGLVAFIVLTSLGTIVTGMVLGLVCIYKGFRRWRIWLLALLGMALCWAAWPVSQAEMNHMIAQRHLIMEP
jgi:hypothetical protein